MGKVFTRFQTKTAQKPYPMGRHIAVWLIYGSTPRVFVVTSGQIQIGTRLALILHAADQDLVLLPSLWLILPIVFLYLDFNMITSLHVSGVHWGECGVTSRCFSCSHLLAPSSNYPPPPPPKILGCKTQPEIISRAIKKTFIEKKMQRLMSEKKKKV